MKTTKINGNDFEMMLRSGLANLRRREQEINDLNVFPVPDGDTGTNMRLTLENGIRHAPSRRESGAYLKGLSEGMLLGARGNSGVILSQLFKGIFLELTHCGNVNPGELRDALVRAYRTAYAAIMRPVEGTLLTVAREGIENVRDHVGRGTSVDDLLSMYLASMKKSLITTPDLLPVLKEAGVVDSGAMGYIAIVEGMLSCLWGEKIQDTTAVDPAPPKPAADLSFFDADSEFTDGYCLEFILQLMNGPEYDHDLRERDFSAALESLGNSLALIRDGSRIRVHVHTKCPEKIIALARKYGEFLTFKLENMQLQHNEHDDRMSVKKATEQKKKFAKVAVVNGEDGPFGGIRLKKIFSGLGCDVVIDGGRTMNTSSNEFIEAIKLAGAERVALLPDSRNIIMAARQAASMIQDSKVTVIETPDIAAGYFALAMDVPDSEDTDFRIAQMREGGSRTVSVSLTKASRDSSYEGLKIGSGREIAICGGQITAVGEGPADTAASALANIPDIDSRGTFLVFCREMSESGEPERSALEDAILSVCPSAEIEFIDAGQCIYDYIIGTV